MSVNLRAGALCAGILFLCASAEAQIPFVPFNADPTTANAAFPPQNALGPSGANYQVNYPFPGQCLADPRNAALFPQLLPCAGGSFACPAGAAPGVSNRTAGGWAACGAPMPFSVVAPIAPTSIVATGQVATPKFVWELLNPPDYVPDTTTFPGADYYEIGVHEAWGYQPVASAGLFPDPTIARCSITQAVCAAGAPPPPGCGTCDPVFPGAPAVPNGMQWTGLTCNIATGCTCPADAAGAFRTQYCSGMSGGMQVIPYGYPLYTPIWGVGQINRGGGPVTALLGLPAGPAAPWSANNYVATWPSLSIRGTKGRPVVVKWVNEFPNNHVLCAHPEAADWPCSIDRTFMGVKATIDPATAGGMAAAVPPDRVNAYGSPQQPDNSWITHLHGAETPPSTDGFPQKWFGNAVTSPLYTPAGGKLINPPFENPSAIALLRPSGNADTYTYPMVQEEATIWFHDHTLGKTHHNVIAGPAGFFPVKDPAKHGALTAWVPPAALPAGSEYTWLDPVTEPRNAIGIPMFDLFLAIQDRAFNDDGSINFANGNGQQPIVVGTAACAAAVAANPAFICAPAGTTPVTPGINPQVHPLWVPEYFGDHALVNGVLWPKRSVVPGWHRLRLVDGSDSRCYTLGLQVSAQPPAPGAAVTFDVPIYVIANDQGYLKAPVRAPGNRLTMCPGERYEVLVDFSNLPRTTRGAAASVWMVNNAPAPFPAGLSPQAVGSPFAELNVLMKFDVNPAFGPGIESCGERRPIAGRQTPVAPAGLTWNPADMAANLNTVPAAGSLIPAGRYQNICMPAAPTAIVDAAFADIRPPVWPLAAPLPPNTVVRQVYLNEQLYGGALGTPLGMQLNGVPFEYKVTETPKKGSREYWQFVNLTVDAHPMHPHLVKHQVVARQRFTLGAYKTILCGAATCMPGAAPGGEMRVVPDVTPFLTGVPALVTAASVEGGWKDVVQVPPNMVTTIVADWTPRWTAGGAPNAPGSAGCPTGRTGCAAPYVYEDAASGPYVWHCHINSHEDSEMMRTSLVVP